MPTTTEETKEEARFGAGIRLRSVHIPRAILELFVSHAATSVNGVGFGLELYRRKGNFELQVGFEYEGLNGDPGLWSDKGEHIPGDDPDDVRFDNFGWFTFEVSFLNHTPLNKYIALRYGGGAGLGVLKGSVRRTDWKCTTASYENKCGGFEDATGANHDKPYGLPPVFPVINAIVGVQIRPVDKVIINIEGGIRSILFFGTTVGYYF